MLREIFGLERPRQTESQQWYAGFTVYQIDTQGKNTTVLSFVPKDLAFPSGIPAEACMGTVGDRLDLAAASAIDPHDFQVNPRFLEFFHRHAAKTFSVEPGVENQARRQGDGYVYVIDPRTPTPDGEVPAEDILGCFAMSAGRILPDSYQPNPNYLIVSRAGLPRFPNAFWNGLITSLLDAGQLAAQRKVAR